MFGSGSQVEASTKGTMYCGLDELMAWEDSQTTIPGEGISALFGGFYNLFTILPVSLGNLARREQHNINVRVRVRFLIV
jgi:hypothetical protein